MPSVKISALPAASALVGNEVIPIVQGGATKRTTAQAIADLATGGGGTTLPGAAYAQYLAALLEPDAIEALQKDTFSYAVDSAVTKMLIASWQTRLGSSGRMEQRNPQKSMALRDVTLAGTASGSCAVILDPAAVTYDDPWATYYNRLERILELPVKNIPITATSQKKPFLPGAYGAIITQVTIFNLAWIIWRIHGTYGPNLWDEISDATSHRIGNSLQVPISKRVAGTIESSSSGSSPSGSVSYVLLPSDWGMIADPVSESYAFRDDFMGAALDTATVWTRAQSTAGNVEIDTTYQWCKLFGNGAWGTNGLRRQASTARSAGVKLVMDVYVPIGAAATGTTIQGFSDGSGHTQASFCHGINFAGTGIINIYEGNTNRGTVGSGYTEGSIYRIRITLGASSATYEIQGGKEYPAIGSASWTDITPGTSNNSTSTLYVAAAAWNGSGYISDPRLFS